jgi:hypothetical protein
MKALYLHLLTHLAAALVGCALALIILPRWQITTVTSTIESKIIRLDRWTGTVETRDLGRSGTWQVDREAQPAP